MRWAAGRQPCRPRADAGAGSVPSTRGSARAGRAGQSCRRIAESPWLRSQAVLGRCTVEHVGIWNRFAGFGPGPSKHVLLAIPVLLVVVITVIDIVAPADVHLGP